MMEDVGRVSSVGIANRYDLDGPRFPAPVQTSPEVQPVSRQICIAVYFPGVKEPRRSVDHPPTSRTEVKERHLIPLWAFMAGYTMKC